MADKKTIEEDDELEIVEVEKLPTQTEIAAREAAAADGKTEGEDEDHEDDEDTRLAEREDEGDGTATKSKRAAETARRRAVRKASRDRMYVEFDSLKLQNAELLQRLTAVEGHTVGITEREIGSKLADAKRRLADFDAILATAVEAGDGAGYVTALSQRDNARDEARTLEATAGRIEEAKKAPVVAKVDPQVSRLADQWRGANPWYDPKAGDEDSAIVNAIDNRLTAEGYNPGTLDYWQELTKRVGKRLGTNNDDTRETKANGVTVRKGPPVGGERSAGSPGNRKEVYVTPERKQAMQDAGKWDDPVERAKMLKSYRDYDARQTAR